MRKKVSELPRNTKVFENMKAVFMCDLLDRKAIFLGLVETLKRLFLWHILKINSKHFMLVLKLCNMLDFKNSWTQGTLLYL